MTWAPALTSPRMTILVSNSMTCPDRRLPLKNCPVLLFICISLSFNDWVKYSSCFLSLSIRHTTSSLECSDMHCSRTDSSSSLSSLPSRETATLASPRNSALSENFFLTSSSRSSKLSSESNSIRMPDLFPFMMTGVFFIILLHLLICLRTGTKCRVGYLLVQQGFSGFLVFIKVIFVYFTGKFCRIR